jgi:hypothetical protein
VIRMLLVVAIALAQPSWISVHAADVSAEAKAAVEEAITELGCSMDVGDEIEANGDGYKAEYVLCADGPYYLTFDKDYKLPARRNKTESKDRACSPSLGRRPGSLRVVRFNFVLPCRRRCHSPQRCG